MSDYKKRLLFRVVIIIGLLMLLTPIVVYVLTVVSDPVGDLDKVVSGIEAVIPERTAGLKEERTENAMSVYQYDGLDYVGILELPRFEAIIPIFSYWNTDIVRFTACRFTGTPYDGSLVIGGTDAKDQFDFISKIDIGDEVSVTNVKGEVFHYKVAAVKHSATADDTDIINEKYDLTLFAKSKKTHDYIFVRCNMN